MTTLDYLVVLSSSCIFSCRILWIWSSMSRRKCILRENCFIPVFKLQHFFAYLVPPLVLTVFSYKSAKIFIIFKEALKTFKHPSREGIFNQPDHFEFITVYMVRYYRWKFLYTGCRKQG